jgi:hypothetical protein
MTEEEEEELDRRKQQKYLRWGACLVILLIIAIVVPVVVLKPTKGVEIFIPLQPTMSPSASPSAGPSSAPTSGAFAILLNTIKGLYNDDETYTEIFQNTSSPQYQAAIWAVDSNALGLGLDPGDPRMVTRYILATFYFSTSGDDWVECSRAPTPCDTKEKEWLSESDECDWLMIACADPSTDGSVTEIFVRKW